MEFGDLTEVEFRGGFQRNPSAARKDLAALRANPDSFTEEEGRGIERDQNRFDFSLWILSYDPNSGLFIARAKDAAGDSGIVGKIKEGIIGFYKTYVREMRMLPDEISSSNEPHFDSCFRRIKYLGQIVKPDGVITAGGDYLMEGYNELQGGIWRMDSTPK